MMRLTSSIFIVLAAALPLAAADAPAPAGLRAPEGYTAAAGSGAEPYTDTGWAAEVVQESTGIELVFIPAGEFEMGTPADEPSHYEDESPIHKVRITKPFYMGKYEVTQEEWIKVMGANPSGFNGDKHPLERPRGRKREPPPEVTPETYDKRPVERVSWNDCGEFLKKAGGGLRLPTEAEWEYACRAGGDTTFNTGKSMTTDAVNFNGKESQWAKGRIGETRDGPVPVGTFAPNAWGLCDMHGNIYEWCSDFYLPGYYESSPADDPKGPETGHYYVIRGGCWNSYAAACRSGERYFMGAGERNFGVGLRVVRPLD